MLFIVSSNSEKVDPDTRKLIRSHVMRGKRLKNGRSDKHQQTDDWIPLAKRAQPTPLCLEEVVENYAPLMPGRIGSDLSFVEFSDNVEPSVLLNMAKVSPIAVRVIFPLLMAIGFQADQKPWFHPVGMDATTLHVTAFAVEAFIDRVLRRQTHYTQPEAILHLQKALRLLRARLLGEDEEEKVSDSTISVVLKLAAAAHFDGDYQASQQHMNGLRKMIDIRGGLDMFQGSRHLLEMLRLDLSIALLNGSNSKFFNRPSEPVSPYPEKLLPGCEEKIYFQGNFETVQIMDSDLATAWQVTRRFCLLVNLGTQTHRYIDPELIRETMTTVIYRLLYMGFDAGSAEETVRLGLLAFCHHVFLQWQDIKMPIHHFPNAYRNCLLSLKHIERLSSQLALWLTMTGATSLFNISEEAWLRELLQEHIDMCLLRSWKEMQGMLKSFMWISLLDDKKGKEIYDFLQNHEVKARLIQ